MHLPEGPKDLQDRSEAFALAHQTAEASARNRAAQAGASQVDITMQEEVNEVPLAENKTLFIEAVIQAQATGIPAA